MALLAILSALASATARDGPPLRPVALGASLVAGLPALNPADGIHPNAAGVQRIAQGILPSSGSWCGSGGAPMRSP